jgi:hypothetical protein
MKHFGVLILKAALGRSFAIEIHRFTESVKGEKPVPNAPVVENTRSVTRNRSITPLALNREDRAVLPICFFSIRRENSKIHRDYGIPSWVFLGKNILKYFLGPPLSVQFLSPSL